MLCYASGFRKHHRWVCVDRSSGDVVWMKPPGKLWASALGGAADAALFEEQAAKLPAGSYKREKLVGVAPRANQIRAKADAERAFVLATARTQLVLIAETVAVKRAWVAACYSVCDRAAASLALAGAKAYSEAEAQAKEHAAAAGQAKAAADQAKAAAAEEAKAARAAADQAKAAAEEEAAAARAAATAEAKAARAAAEAAAEASRAEAEAAKAAAAAEADAALAWAEAEAAAAKAEAEAEAAAAKAEAEAHMKVELARGQQQLDEAIAEHGGGTLRLSEERTCVCCYDDFSGFNDGVACGGAEPHFLCNECFAISVRSAVSDEPAKQGLRGGRVACPFATFPPTEGSCGAACFDDKVVARATHGALPHRAPSPRCTAESVHHVWHRWSRRRSTVGSSPSTRGLATGWSRRSSRARRRRRWR